MLDWSGVVVNEDDKAVVAVFDVGQDGGEISVAAVVVCFGNLTAAAESESLPVECLSVGIEVVEDGYHVFAAPEVTFFQ